MNTQQSSLKNLLTNMIETLTPEIEQDFDDYIESTSVKDKALNFFEDNTEFLEKIIDTLDMPDGAERVMSDSKFRDRIMNNLSSLFFYNLALAHDLRNRVQIDKIDQDSASNNEKMSPSDRYGALEMNTEPKIIEINEHVTVTCYPAVRKPDSDYNALVIIVNYPSDYSVDEDAAGRTQWAFGGQEPFNCHLGLVVDTTDTPGPCPTIHFDSISGCWYVAGGQ